MRTRDIIWRYVVVNILTVCWPTLVFKFWLPLTWWRKNETRLQNRLLSDFFYDSSLIHKTIPYSERRSRFLTHDIVLGKQRIHLPPTGSVTFRPWRGRHSISEITSWPDADLWHPSSVTYFLTYLPTSSLVRQEIVFFRFRTQRGHHTGISIINDTAVIEVSPRGGRSANEPENESLAQLWSPSTTTTSPEHCGIAISRISFRRVRRHPLRNLWTGRDALLLRIWQQVKNRTRPPACDVGPSCCLE